MADAPPGISAAPKDDNLRHFDVTVAGPGQSPYEGTSIGSTSLCSTLGCGMISSAGEVERAGLGVLSIAEGNLYLWRGGYGILDRKSKASRAGDAADRVFVP